MITAERLKEFCADSRGGKYALNEPHIFIHEGKPFSYGTDGHRIVIVEGRVDGVAEYKDLNIAQFLVEPQGVEVNCAALKAFLGCDRPTRGNCKTCGGRGKVKHECNCDRCASNVVGDEYDPCGCDGRKYQIVNYGWLGIVPFNRSLLADAMKDVDEPTVRIHITGKQGAFYVFTSDRRIGVMPMTDEVAFKAAPRFTVESK